MLTAIAIAAAFLIAVGVDDGLQRHGRHKDRVEVQAQQEAAQADALVMAGDLAECRAKVTPEAIDATGRVLAAAQVGELADTQLRAAVVEAIPQALLAEAVIATGSPQSIAAESAMARCAASNTTGDSGRSGCAVQVPATWAAAVAELAGCPELAAQ